MQALTWSSGRAAIAVVLLVAVGALAAPQRQRSRSLPAGRADGLVTQKLNANQNRVWIQVPPPENAAERIERFRLRNSPPAIRELCRELHAVLKLETKGLEGFRRQYEAANYQAALDAYRAYFVAKLRRPEEFGLLSVLPLGAKTKPSAVSVFVPDPEILALEKSGIAVLSREQAGTFLLGKLGEPGGVNWAPRTLPYVPARLPDATPAQREMLKANDFFLFLGQFPSQSSRSQLRGLFPSLLFAYGAHGDAEALKQWAAYMDDWCLNAKRDMDESPANIRGATEADSSKFQHFLQQLAQLAALQPNFEQDFPSATLARMLMRQIEERAPYTLRAKRTELANWGMVGCTNLLLTARFLPEFKAMDYFRREAWRLWNINLIQHRTLDGVNVESQDEGHAYTDLQFFFDYLDRKTLPMEVSDMEWTEFMDRMRVTLRGLLAEITPTGSKVFLFADLTHFLAKTRTNSVDYRFVRRNLGPINDALRSEAELRARVEAVTGARLGRPEVLSEVVPYMARYYLRDSWKPDGEYVSMWDGYFQSQGPNLKSEVYLLRGDYMLGYVYPILVDRRPPHAAYGKQHDAGGKTTYLGQAGRHVTRGRFHTSSRFDVAEAVQDAPYAFHEQFIHNMAHFPLLNNPAFWRKARISNPPIRDVAAWRQVFSVRGEGLYIINDRIQSDGEHEFTQPLYLPARLDRDTPPEVLERLKAQRFSLIEEDEDGQLVRTRNAGYPNLTLRLFHRQKLAFANGFDNDVQFHRLPRTAFEERLAALSKPDRKLAPNELTPGRPVTARWSGRGDQVLVSLATTRAQQEDALKDASVRDVRRLDGPGGVTGFSAVTRNGKQVFFQSGPSPANELRIGPARARAEALLLVLDKGEWRGIALGAAGLELNGKECPAAAPDFEFVLRGGETFEATPIRRPIDTVRIEPEENVFVGSTRVSFTIPRGVDSPVEYRYTLDGSDPTVESPLYNGPFAIDRTTMVKVTAFRAGLKKTPYRQCGTDSSAMMTTVFERQEYRPAVEAGGTEPGLFYEYFEDNWPRLFTYAGVDGVLKPVATGTAGALLDRSAIAGLRKSGGPYAIRYTGYIEVPADGVYAFRAPQHLFDTTADAGFDLRVFVAGEEWLPAPRVHSENMWYIALKAGKHRFKVVFVDFRGKQFRDEYWMSWKPGTVWEGMPELAISGPGVPRQAIPASMLLREAGGDDRATGQIHIERTR